MNIYAGNLSWNLKDQDLQNLFATHGEVTSAKIVTDKFNNNRSKGFGFVEMSTESEAQKAIQDLNGTMQDGRSIMVSEAKPEAPRGGGRGGFGGGGNRGGGGGRDRGDRW